MTQENSRRNLLMRSAAVAAAVASLSPSRSIAQQGNSVSGKPAKPLGAKTGESIKPAAAPAAHAAGNAANAAPPPPSLYVRDQAHWAQIQNRASTYYGIKPGTPESLALPTTIESTFKFTAKDEDLYFRMQNVESLLNQSADLLERALATRTQWNDLQTKAFNVAMELQQFFELDKIHQRETAAGFYTHDAAEAAKLLESETKNQSGFTNQSNFIKQFIYEGFFADDDLDTLSGSSQELAWLAQVANPKDTTWDGDHDTPANLAADAANTLSSHSLETQRALLMLQIGSMNINAEVSQAKVGSLQVKSAWETANSGFRMDRTQVSRHLADRKAEAYTQPGGALNYPERMTRLEAVFARDFRDALARTGAAAQGASQMYSFADPLPASVTSALAGGSVDPGAYEDCLIWVRNAIAYLVKFGQVDQRYSLPISIKAQLGKDGFENGRKVKDWATWSFKVPRDFFPHQYFVRLRGATVYVVNNKSKGVWTGTISPPRASFYEHLNKAGQPVVHVDADQSNIPPAICGRISFRDNVRTPDVIGVSSLNNVSPFTVEANNDSNWTVKIAAQSSQGEDIVDIEDVVLELHLAMRIVS